MAPVAVEAPPDLDTFDDLQRIMHGVEESSVDPLEDANLVMGATGALGGVNDWSSPEAIAKGKNFVRHERRFGGRWSWVYDVHGNDHHVLQEDVAALCFDRDLAKCDGQGAGMALRYMRCPKCVRLPNRGVHAKHGPNGCPAREPRLVTYCDICKASGHVRLIYEDHDPQDSGVDLGIEESDPLLRHPAVPTEQNRENALQQKLNDHIRAFHITIARRRGLRSD